MKKNILKWLWCLPALALGMASCEDREELHFDYEEPQFATTDNAILLEVVVPVGTAATDQIYVVGDFNGGEDAIGDAQWLLEKAANTDAKFGIYLYPSDFKDGKTLADGYYFYSMQQGEQRTVFGDSILMTDNAGLGQRIDLKIAAWASRFNSGDKPIEHDGYVVYVNDQTGWAALNLYMWGDVNDLNGGWPGMTPTGTQIINGTKYKYFDMGEDNTGKSENLIFNNGDGKQLADFAFTIDRDIYLKITESGVTEETVEPIIEHDGYAVFVIDNTGWEGPMTLYMWGDVNDLNGGWPGMEATGECTIKGNHYLYFDMGEANTGKNENLIFSNNGASQYGDFNFTIDRDIYLLLANKTVTEIDPETYTSGDEPTPPDPVDVTHTIYVQNNTTWSELALYAWGDVELFGGWPGAVASATETIGDYTFYTFTATAPEGAEEHLIFNNNGAGTQFDGPVINFDHDLYLVITDEGCTEIERPAPTTVTNTIYVKNLTSWSAVSLYAWGTAEVFGGWPGANPTTTQTIQGTQYLSFEITGPVGGEEHLIFNNAGAGIQYDGPIITLGQDYYLTITDEGATNSSFTVYVDNQTGWEAITCYMWGDINDLNGGWPGMASTGTKTIGDVTYTCFEMGEAASGKSENLIFNNNGGGIQHPDYNLKFTRDYYLTVTATGVAEK